LLYAINLAALGHRDPTVDYYLNLITSSLRDD